MDKWMIEKNGWHIQFSRGNPYWEENEPQYNIPCNDCNSTGEVVDHDENCVGICMCPTKRCSTCGGKGKLRSAPLTPKPDDVIINILHLRLINTLVEFGNDLNSGRLEEDIANQKAIEDSLISAGL